jgi:hypothetical protein
MTTKRPKDDDQSAPKSGFQLQPNEPRPDPEYTGKPWGGAEGGAPVEPDPQPEPKAKPEPKREPAPKSVAPKAAPEGTLT